MVLMIALVQQQDFLVMTLVKLRKKNLHYIGDESYLYVNKTEICKFKANDNISRYNFCSKSVSKAGM